MQRDVANKGGSLEVRTLKDKMPDCWFFREDSYLFVEPYLMGYTGRDCPVFCLRLNDTNRPVFDAFTSAMELKWNCATRVTYAG